jgi:hypothetical protein
LIDKLSLIGAEFRYGSGMFGGSQHFTVTGQNFANITNHYPSGPMVPSGKLPQFVFEETEYFPDFRMISLGDIDLRTEIHLNNGVDQQTERRRVRRIYSGKVNGEKANVTVAMYQGNGAEVVRHILLPGFCD